MDPGIINVSCLFTEAGRRDFSYFETFWSEFKPENGQLAQNKADSKLTPTVFLLLCIVFVIHLHCICFVLELYLYHGKKSICGKLILLASCRHNFKVELWSVDSLPLHPCVENIIFNWYFYGIRVVFVFILNCICVKH